MKHLLKYHLQSDPEYNVEHVKYIVITSMSNKHYHNNYEIACIYSGERYYYFEDGMYHVKPGGMTLIKPYIPHNSSAASQGEYERILVSFNDEFLADFDPAIKDRLFYVFMENHIALNLNETQFVSIKAIFNKMLYEFNSNDKNNDIYNKILLSELLITISRLNFNSIRIPKTDKMLNKNITDNTVTLINKAAQFIRKNYAKDITLKVIAENLFVSPAHLSRTFKKTGSGIVEYKNNLKIIEAKNLLKNTTQNITEIAQNTGFSSPNDFTRVFKKYMGISPLKYRKRYENV